MVKVTPRVDETIGGREPVDPNWADQEALVSIQGIDPATAERIMRAREDRSFASLRDFRERAPLAPAVWDAIRDRIRIEE